MMHDGVKHIASSIGDPGDVAPITPQMVNFALGMLNWINETPDGGVRERQFLAPIAHLFKEPNDNTSQE
jgi:hypothetical protein